MKAAKYGVLLLSGFLVYQNGKYAKKYEHIAEFAEQETFYLKPFFSFSSFMLESSNSFYKYIKEPPVEKYLPDEPPFNKALLRKALVLNFEGTMYSKDMQNGNGLIIHLRPGFRKFIKEMQKHYEIVVYSNEDGNFLSEVMRNVDPY